MSTQEAGARLDELEARLAFQEHALGEISDTVAELRSESARLLLMLRRAMDDMRQLRAGLATDLTGDPGHEPPPPHY